MTRRALHWVFKIGDRSANIEFFRDILGMQVLRHEEFEKGCDAKCNGPYDGKWSKTMIGFGSEHDHFVIELVYNYGLASYTFTKDVLGLSVSSAQAVENARKRDLFIQSVTIEPKATATLASDSVLVHSPDGYPFHLNIQPSESEFWHTLLNMRIYSQENKKVVLGYADNQIKLEFLDIGMEVQHGTAHGRLAFSCPANELSAIERSVRDAGYTVLTSLVTLKTPGKADVEVVILADPDGYEICFVGDEAFRKLSAIDPKAGQLLEDAMKLDKSKEWFDKHGGKPAC